MTASSGEKSHVTIGETHSIFGDAVWTQQSGGCGEQGDQIYASYSSVGRASFGKELVREWAKFRYGVFDERGFAQDPVYPKCFLSDRTEVTGCSDAPLDPSAICRDVYGQNLTAAVDAASRSSILFSAESPSVAMFCDEGNHNRYAPTKQNQLCNRQSSLQVILQHPDFQPQNHSTDPVTDTTPLFLYKRRRSTRYVLVLDETRDMQVRESWNYLRTAIRKWVHHDLPSNTEVGVVLANGTATHQVLPLQGLHVDRNRDAVSSFIPYAPSEFSRPGCLSCAIRDAVHMLDQREASAGSASHVILVIAPGMDFSTDSEALATHAREHGVRIVTINYPDASRLQPLDVLAERTDGSAYTVLEQKQNKDDTYLSTYFELSNTLLHIGHQYFEGDRALLPLEIHRRQIVDLVDETSASSRHRGVTGSFMLDASLGEPAHFLVYTHRGDSPMVSTFTLTSPSGVTYSARSDARLSVKQLTLQTAINETGTWTYFLKRDNGYPQPHYVQVLATPRSPSGPVIRARAWVRRSPTGGPLRLFAEVLKGDLPIRSAHVEVTVTKHQCNATYDCSRTFRLLDTGSGDPDVTRGDGVYSRYFSAAETGPGTYSFEVTVSDNGNTAYSLSEDAVADKSRAPEPCCGSVVQTPSKQPLPPFERTLPKITLLISRDQLPSGPEKLLGKVGDLKAELVDGARVRLSWSSPDLGGQVVARYELKYATAIADIVDHFETAAVPWTHSQAHPYSIGDETSLTLNMTSEPSLLGRPLYFALRAYSKLVADAAASEVSNFVRVFVPLPTPPTQATPSYLDRGLSSWPFGSSSQGDSGDDVAPPVAQAMPLGLELILPIVGVLVLLLVACLFCYCCLLRRRGSTAAEDKKKSIQKSSSPKGDHQTVNVIVPSPTHTMNGSLMHGTLKPLDRQGTQDLPDPHTVGLPVYNMDDELMDKHRYSLVSPQHQHQDPQLIEELRAQQAHLQQMGRHSEGLYAHHVPPQPMEGQTLGHDGRILSPYESWTASQLLHEHERRISPTEEVLAHHQGIMSNDHLMLLHGGGPPVPPLPYHHSAQEQYQQSGYDPYGTSAHQPPPMYSSIQRNPQQSHNSSFEASHQGSLNSVDSTEKRIRNVTMV